ncbi:MAG: alpha/beta hydrolase [Chloroflexota bacterium]
MMSDGRTIEFENSRGWRLVATLSAVEQEDAPLVIVAHNVGENRHTPAYRRVLKGLQEAGLNSLALDLSGHGDSGGRVCEGPEQYARDIAEAVLNARSQLGLHRSPVALAATGISGTAALYAMSVLEVDARTAVLRSPPLYRYERLATGITVPVLILVGSLDPVWSELRRLARSLPEGSELREIPGSRDADMVDASGEVDRASLEWLTRTLPGA